MNTDNNNINDKFSIGTVIGNKYKLIRLITRGTFSAIYECEHIIKKNKAVIKMETNDIAKRLMKHEVNVYMSLQKSKVRIPRIKNTGEDGNIQYMIMELLKESLKEYNGSISIHDLYKQLYLLHLEGFLHRDIKPDNFVVGFDQQVYMIDLGLSKYDDNKITTGFIGNRRYASPVCFDKIYNYHKKDDVLSLTYMILDLKYGYLPWDYEGIERSNVDFNKFYINEPLCEILKICQLDFNYSDIFKIVDKIDYKLNLNIKR
jgi:serine/threonine protein kinase